MEDENEKLVRVKKKMAAALSSFYSIFGTRFSLRTSFPRLVFSIEKLQIKTSALVVSPSLAKSVLKDRIWDYWIANTDPGFAAWAGESKVFEKLWLRIEYQCTSLLLSRRLSLKFEIFRAGRSKMAKRKCPK